jgi:hypothetical protein
LLKDIKGNTLELKFSVGLQLAVLKGGTVVDIYPEIKKPCSSGKVRKLRSKVICIVVGK